MAPIADIVPMQRRRPRFAKRLQRFTSRTKRRYQNWQTSCCRPHSNNRWRRQCSRHVAVRKLLNDATELDTLFDGFINDGDDGSYMDTDETSLMDSRNSTTREIDQLLFGDDDDDDTIEQCLFLDSAFSRGTCPIINLSSKSSRRLRGLSQAKHKDVWIVHVVPSDSTGQSAVMETDENKNNDTDQLVECRQQRREINKAHEFEWLNWSSRISKEIMLTITFLLSLLVLQYLILSTTPS